MSGCHCLIAFIRYWLLERQSSDADSYDLFIEIKAACLVRSKVQCKGCDLCLPISASLSGQSVSLLLGV